MVGVLWQAIVFLSMTFSHFRASSKPIYGQLEILNLEDQVFLQNCLFVYALINNSPICFSGYFTASQDIHCLGTRGASSNSLFVKHNSTLKYGIHSITSQCIFNWNRANKILKQNLLLVTRGKLIFLLKQHFLQSFLQSFSSKLLMVRVCLVAVINHCVLTT